MGSPPFGAKLWPEQGSGLSGDEVMALPKNTLPHQAIVGDAAPNTWRDRERYAFPFDAPCFRTSPSCHIPGHAGGMDGQAFISPIGQLSAALVISAAPKEAPEEAFIRRSLCRVHTSCGCCSTDKASHELQKTWREIVNPQKIIGGGGGGGRYCQSCTPGLLPCMCIACLYKKAARVCVCCWCVTKKVVFHCHHLLAFAPGFLGAQPSAWIARPSPLDPSRPPQGCRSRFHGGQCVHRCGRHTPLQSR